MNDAFVSYIRTIVPVAIGWAAAHLIAWGIDVDVTTLSGALVPIVIGLYYLGVRLAERRWPVLGWLLGLPKQPTYR